MKDKEESGAFEDPQEFHTGAGTAMAKEKPEVMEERPSGEELHSQTLQSENLEDLARRVIASEEYRIEDAEAENQEFEQAYRAGASAVKKYFQKSAKSLRTFSIGPSRADR